MELKIKNKILKIKETKLPLNDVVDKLECDIDSALDNIEETYILYGVSETHKSQTKQYLANLLESIIDLAGIKKN